MKIGDMVIRAYAWRDVVPGIIVDELRETWKSDGDTTDPETSCEYEEVNFVVLWADGSQSNLTPEELDFLEEHLSESW